MGFQWYDFLCEGFIFPRIFNQMSTLQSCYPFTQKRNRNVNLKIILTFTDKFQVSMHIKPHQSFCNFPWKQCYLLHFDDGSERISILSHPKPPKTSSPRISCMNHFEGTVLDSNALENSGLRLDRKLNPCKFQPQLNLSVQLWVGC